MNSTVSHKHHHNPLLHYSTLPVCRFPALHLSGAQNFRTSRRRRTAPPIRSSSSGNANGSGGFSWRDVSESLRRGSEKLMLKFSESVKEETAFDFGRVNAEAGELLERAKVEVSKGEAELTRFRTVVLPEFLDWNSWERWKDVKHWERKRVAALILYAFVVLFSFQRVYVAVRAPFIARQKKEATEAFMEALIPEPTPINVRKFKKGIWRKTVPKGLKMKKFVQSPDRTLIRDTSYVGEDAWDDDAMTPQENVKQIIENYERLNTAEKKELEEDLGISGN
ncbi:unnamed protein product [Linum trigynum]|uniref:Uncharacterized protein n=1 Tax=Linum trigynum TaxID=586398 RepID=A0AAV2F176_9ROSI